MRNSDRWGRALTGLFLFLALSLSLSMRGSNITTAISAGPSGCFNCVEGPDLRILGGMIGGQWRNAANNVNANINQLVTASRIFWPTSGGFTGLTACIAAPMNANGMLMAFWETKDIAVAVTTDSDPDATYIAPGAAAGCYQNAGNSDVHEAFVGKTPNVRSIVSNSVVATGWSASIIGSRSQPLAAFYNGALVGAGATIFGNVGQGTAFAATEPVIALPLPIAGSFRRLSVTTTTGQPGTGTLVLTLLDNGVATACTITIAAGSAAGVYYDAANTCAIAAGNTFSWSLTNNAAANSAAVNTIAMEFVPTAAADKGLLLFPGRAQVLIAGASRFVGPFVTNTVDAVEVNVAQGFPRGYTVSSPMCYVQTAPAANTTTVTLFRNGAGTGVTVSITVAGGVGVIAGAGTQAFTALDTFSLEYAAGAGAVPVIAGCVAGLS